MCGPGGTLEGQCSYCLYSVGEKNLEVWENLHTLYNKPVIMLNFGNLVIIILIIITTVILLCCGAKDGTWGLTSTLSLRYTPKPAGLT